MLGNTTAAKRGLCVTICSRRTCKSARRCEAADLHVVGLKQSQGDLRGHQCAHAAYLCAEGGEGRGRRSEHLHAGRVGRDLLAAYVEERRGERRDALNVVDTVPGPCRDPKCVTRLRLDDPAARSSVVISSHLMQSHSISRNLVSSYAISCNLMPATRRPSGARARAFPLAAPSAASIARTHAHPWKGSAGGNGSPPAE